LEQRRGGRGRVGRDRGGWGGRARGAVVAETEGAEAEVTGKCNCTTTKPLN